MADQTQRLEIATVKAEIGSDILSRFSNDAVGASPIPTGSGDIQNLKQVIVDIQEEGTEKISFATTIYPTTAAGIAGTTNGAIFLVRSADPDEIYAVYSNTAGVAVDTGKRALSATAIQTAMDVALESANAAEDSADLATARTARFLASVSTPPVIRDDGTPLQLGDRYLSTANQAEYIYKSSGWVANESQAAISGLSGDLADQADSAKGAALVGHNGKTVANALDSLQMSVNKTISTHERLAYMKRLALSLAIQHPEFDYLLNTLGVRFYPQALVIDEYAGKLLLIDGVEPSRTVLMYNWPSGTFDRMFFLSATLVSEGAIIKVENGVKYLYMRSTGDRLARWDITNYPASRSTIAPAAFGTSVVAGLCTTYRNGRWTLGDTTVDYTGLRSRGRFALFDDSFAIKGALDCGRWQLGIYAGQDGDTSMTKTQGICDTGYGIVACMGGQQLAANAESPYGSIGTRTFNYDGKMIGEALCTSAGLRAVLTSAYGLAPTQTEAEGIVCLSNGEVYSLIVTNGWGDAAAATQGMTILQEFDSRGADFSAAAIPRSQSLGDFGTLTTTPSGTQLVNFASPATPVTTVTQLITAMVQSGLKVFEWRPDQISILDVSGAAYAAGQTKARLEVFDSTRAYVTVTGFNYYYRARIRNTSGAWDEQQVSDPVHTQQYAFDGTKAGDLSFRNYNNDSLSLRMVNTSGTGILASLGTSGARIPNVYGVNGNFSGPVNIGAYTLTTLPSASAYPNALILVTNASGGAKWCMSNGIVWQIINTTTTVS